MVTKGAANAPPDRASWSFGQLLDWHLNNGTRPAGAPDSPGKRWTNKAFAAAIGVNERTVRNWRNGASLPNGLDSLERELFGENRAYADWRRELRAAFDRKDAAADSRRSATIPISQATPPTSLPTRPLRCFGRDDDVSAVVKALTAGKGSTAILILGGAGMGKTTLTREAATHEEVERTYGTRRWFVELETAPNAEVMAAAIIAKLGLDPATANFDSALARLREAPGVLVLDNLETPWEGDRATVERLLGQFAPIKGLTLLASIRGREAPPTVRWDLQREVTPLGEPDALALFRDIAPGIDINDMHLNLLLAQLGGVPLAIELVALEGARFTRLDDVWRQWQEAGTSLARRRGMPLSRLTSLEKSLELSLSSNRLGEAGHRLFRFLGQLPAGIAPEDRQALLGSDHFDAASDLLATGLAIERGDRLDLLPPIRNHAQRFHAPESEDAKSWRQHYLNLARHLGARIGYSGGSGAVRRLAPELPNIDQAMRAAIDAADLDEAKTAAWGLAELMMSTGSGSGAVIRSLALACRNANDLFGEADSIFSFGRVAFERSDHQAAHEAYEQARTLYRQAQNVLGEANCMYCFGKIALTHSDHQAARTTYEQALTLYRQIGDSLGEANCIQNLGAIAFRRSDYETARQAYEQALPLYRQVANVLGEANCIYGLGDIALGRSEYRAAREAFEQARTLYRQVGDLIGEANCIDGLGDIAFALSDYRAAREAFEQALRLYRQVANVLGEANCIQSLGDIALRESDKQVARDLYLNALALFGAISAAYSIGRVNERLASISRGSERKKHLEAARAAWTAADRPDLVAKLKE